MWNSQSTDPSRTDLGSKHPKQASKVSKRALFAYVGEVQTGPKDPAVLKILRVVNFLRVVFLLSPCDLLSRRALCGDTIFLGITDIFPLREGSVL